MIELVGKTVKKEKARVKWKKTKKTSVRRKTRHRKEKREIKRKKGGAEC